MLSKIIKNVLKIIKSAKISIKLTIVYAFMFSLVLLILNASILFGVRYYLYNQANKQVKDVQTIISNKITAQNEELDLSNKEFFTDISSEENISIKIIQINGKIINSKEKFNHEKKDKEKHVVYKNFELQSNQ